MSRGYAQKRLHYVRAAYNPGTQVPAGGLERALRVALTAKPTMVDTEVQQTSLGTLAVRFRDVGPADFIFLAIGRGVPNESIGTMGLGVAAAVDSNAPELPPNGRAFKLAEAYCLIDEDDLIVITDGSMRVEVVDFYLRSLLALANASPASQAFGLIARLNQDKANTLSSEGVRAIKMEATAYAATQVLDGAAPPGNWLEKGWHHFISEVRARFEEEAENDAERTAVAQHWSDLNIKAEISVRGGTRGEPVVVKQLEGVAFDAMDESPAGTSITLVSGKGTEIRENEIVLRATKTVKRLQNQNDLDHTDAWKKLQDYRSELVQSNRWKV